MKVVGADCSERGGGGGGAKLTGGGCAAKASIPSHSSPVPLASKSHKQILLLLYKPVLS